MKNVKAVSVLLFTLILTFVFGGITPSFAESNGLPFAVEPILTKDQDKNTSNYISVSPTTKSYNQEFKFKITNQSNEKQDIKTTVVDAYSSPNGVIQYVEQESENSKITKEDYKLSNYLKAENDVITLEQGETKVISTVIDVDSIDGVLLGGVSFSAIEKGEKQEEGDSTFQINNEINMVIGVKMNFETDKDAEFILEQPFIDPMPSYFVIRLPMTLNSPVLKQNTKLNYQVMYKNKELFSNEKELNFAPYTKTNVAIPFEHDEIKGNGTYTIKGELVYKDKEGEEVMKEFEETFQYDKQDKNKNTVMATLKAPIEKSGLSLWVILISLIPLIAIGALIYKKRKRTH